MAKIAGRKNAGAWYRTNQALIYAGSAVQTALATTLAGDAKVIAL